MEAIHTIEIAANQWLQSLGTWLVTPFNILTFLGDEEFFILMLAALYWCVNQALGIKVAVMLLIANSTNAFFKFLFRTPRPFWFSDSVIGYHSESSFGLPSGHSQLPASVWGWLAVEVRKKWFTAVALLIIFLIGLSRIYLGLHFLTDVLLGWTLGGLLVWAASAFLHKKGDWLSGLSSSRKILLITLVMVVLVSMNLVARWISTGWVMPADWAARAGDIDPFSLDGTFTMAGTWFGLLTGYVWLMEKRGAFLASQGGWKRVLRFLVGLIGIVILWFGLGQVFPRGANLLSYSLRFVRYSLTGWWASWIAPLVFEKLSLLNFADRT